MGDNFGRKVIQIVELDIEYCGLTFGTAPCTAALSGDVVRKCFNTWATCRLSAADRTTIFSSGTKTLRFAQSVNGLPKGTKIYPFLAGPVSTNAATVNLGGVDETTGPFGKRARVTVRFKDAPDSDIGMDKYQSGRKDGTAQTDEGGYEPGERGTFFGKLRARFPYYEGRALRVLEGYEGESLASMRTRNYVISEWTGPDANGNVTITAKDVLDLADNKKAVCPAQSQGKLTEAISSSFTGSVDLRPETIGDTYGASGRVCIGSEIMTYTMSGDTMTITARGLDGTTAESHAEGDLAQECYHVENTSISTIAADLLENYAGISASWLPTTDWDDEADRWLAGFNLTTTIVEPTGVTTLMGELSQFGVMWWWDDVAQEVKMRPNRPLDISETAPSITDAKNILAATQSKDELDAKRLSEISMFHGMKDWSVGPSSGNFDKSDIWKDPNAETPNEYNQLRLKKVYTRWLGYGDAAIAGTVVSRLGNRYKVTPQQISFQVDIKDNASIDLAAPITVSTRVIQDEVGSSDNVQMQVTSIEEVESGNRLAVTAETYRFTGRYGFITENSRADYASSSASEQALGTYIVDDGTLVFGDGTGPYLMF